jgi:leader peptidase (prepilin peptidase) / N-methyltransferase
LGAVAGSFIATLTERWPSGQTVAGRSRCDHCARQLTPADLVPILSWLALKGRCRACHTPIGARAPLVEGAAAVIGALAILASPNLAGLTGSLFGWFLLTLALLDLEHFWLPDRLTATLGATGLLASFLTRFPSLSDSIIGAIVGFAALELVRILYRAARKREGLGGGDPKLFAGIGAWLGWQYLPFALLLSCLIGLIAVLISRLRGKKVKGDQMIPFGALLCLSSYPLWLFLGFYRDPNGPITMLVWLMS